MSGPTVILSSAYRRQQAHRLIDSAPVNSVVEVSAPGRTLPQNARLHAMITDVARQIEWPVGSGTKRTVEAWKDIFTAALRSANHGLDVVPGLNGGFVLLGMHTSRMTKTELGDLMTLIEAFGAEHGVMFNEPATLAKQSEAA